MHGQSGFELLIQILAGSLCILLFAVQNKVNASVSKDYFSATPYSEKKLSQAYTWSKKFCNWKVSLPLHSKGTNNGTIIGMATGTAYTFDKLIPFCKSIRSTGFQGEVLIGVSKLGKVQESNRKEMFHKYNITGIHLDGMKGSEWGQSICRYHAYLEFVKHYVHDNTPVLVSDVRDVFFQSNPFTSFPLGAQNFLNNSVELLLFSEGLNDISEKKATLRNTRGNLRWLRNIYGPKSRELESKPVLCSGTTIGSKEGLYHYTRTMLYEGYCCLKRNMNKYDGKRGHVCSGGADQGFHNYVFWNKKLSNAVYMLNAAGPVYTIGIFRGKPVRSLNFARNRNGDLLSPPERGIQFLVPVIHQWDRHEDLLEHVFQKFKLESEGVSRRRFNFHLLDGSFSGKSKHRGKRGL